jgi:hypothetical protein
MFTKNALLYRKTTPVQAGDEYYHVFLKKDRGNGIPFEIEIFHGLAGKLEERPEISRSFETEECAVAAFETIIKDIELKGFCLYSPVIHGSKDF